VNSIISDAEMFVAEAMLQQLLRQQMTRGNTQLLIVGVSGHLDHLHAVEQRWWYGGQRVSSRDEQYL